MASEQFEIPFALDDTDTPVAVKDAVRDTTYRCPNCHKAVSFVPGLWWMSRFSHDADDGCSLEIARQAAAKYIVASAVNRAVDGAGPRPVWVRHCSRCGSSLKKWRLAPDVSRAEVGRVVGDDVIIDVALSTDSGQLRAVQVRHDDAITPREARRLCVLGIPWVELSAEEVVEQPSRWHIVAASARKALCEKCRAGRRGTNYGRRIG